jgi:hypothetical protein
MTFRSDRPGHGPSPFFDRPYEYAGAIDIALHCSIGFSQLQAGSFSESSDKFYPDYIALIKSSG